MTASILIPTRGRPGYLDVALASVAPQAAAVNAEVIVIADGHDPRTTEVARRHRARVLTSARPGANAARNHGIEASRGDPVVLIDDDIRAAEGWLDALLSGVGRYADDEVFGGPITASIEPAPSSCGREGAPMTTLDLGPDDREAAFVWSANMAIRRSALTRVGPFDETILGRGEEEEWERRYAAAGGRVRYLAAAGVEHRRTGDDALLPALARASFALGVTARRYDVRKGTAPSRVAELRTVLGCAVHVVRYRCPNMIAVGAHAAGRLRQALAEGRR